MGYRNCNGGTFVVIAASATAALIQLRHMRGSNQIVALTELRETLESEAFQTRLHEVIGPFQMSRRYVYGTPELQSVLTIAAFFENVGVLVKHRIVDAELFCDLWAGVRLTEDFLEKHPHGTLSAQLERRKPTQLWPESAEYVKS